VNYTLSDNNSHILYPNESNTNNHPNLPTYRKVYSNIQARYCALIKKKVIYANPTKAVKEIKVTSLNPNNLKIKKPLIPINAYSNGEIQLRMYFDHTMKKNQ